jgi:hypothetical protein
MIFHIYRGKYFISPMQNSEISAFNIWVNGVFKHKLDQQDP